MSTETALVVIDVQKGIMQEAYQRDEILGRIDSLLTRARASGIPVIYVQHDESKGYELEVGTDAWQIHPAIAPQNGEPVVNKRASDAFYNTRLKQELDRRGIRHLIVAGAQTEYCVDTTVRRATTCGYDVTLVGDAHTTYDRDLLSAPQIIAHTNEVLDGFRTDTCTIIVKPGSAISF